MPAPEALPGMSKSWSPPILAPSPACTGLCAVCSCVQALTSSLQPHPCWGSSSCSGWYTSGSMKYSRLRGCDSVVQLLSGSHLPLPSELDAGLLGCSCCSQQVLLLFIYPPHPAAFSCIITNPHNPPGRRAGSMIFILLFKGRVLEKGDTGWAPWIGIWEVRVQFLPLLSTVLATLGRSLPPIASTHTLVSVSSPV